MTELMEEIRKRIVFFDGGTGSLLQANGLKPGELPETWNILHPEIVTKLHYDYLEAGADIVKTNTFGANGLKFNDAGEYGLDEIVAAAMENAKKAVSKAGDKGYIALDIGPTGKLLKPLGDLGFEEAYRLFSDVVAIGAREGADLVLIETMSDSYEVKAAVLAAKENCNLPVFATMIFDSKGKLLTGGTVESTVALLEGLGVDALGINCGLGPVQMKGILADIMKAASVPVIVNPNAGLPRSEGGRTFYDIDADEFAGTMREIVEMGACVVGGCCGTTPEHIRKTIALCKDQPARMPEKKNRTVISSYAQAVEIDKNPVLIGERINPTGKSKFKQALRDHNLEYILREGVAQQDNGAHVLDVNVGLPEIDEAAMMEEVVMELQSIIDLPLQIDTSNIQAMERALRVYNGKPLINSVNGKQEVMEAVFPLVKRYGGVVVALALDEDGIPETADGRLKVAEKIYAKASEYGIERKDIVIDALCMTVSSDSRGAITTLETVRRVRDELGGKTILGVSNISFGLPQREIVNAAFFTMALQNGLNAAIINPNSEAMMRSYYSFRVLADLDPQCSEYISVYSGQVATLGQTVRQGGGSGKADGSGSAMSASLAESIERGLKESAHQAVTELLKTLEPLVIINEEMIPALDRVGKGFEKGTVFLPQLLMSAEAAKAAFEVIKEQLAKSGREEEKKGKIILATVKGDIHDIGKNIVKVLLENYGYDVIDLGKDVPPELVVETAVEQAVKLVGLSALMTTTVPSMEETIRQLQKTVPGIRVMVGGAVLTEEYAKTIGADRYCRDAMASVNYAEKVFAGE
ncbi:homocysteine S-methyltransferase family protein [Hungatella hathewayi]|uniref:homocysteine S-methyltransferase family protein n=2 Tax=Hungatella hathewayi TaxID=154046 RepID=UPI000E542ED2|nr:homocysteine S-methyltransferase family protein [Hungatella hathewayi]MBS6755674.1 homocysteine S-methyltransferase family protein [Hungatella hathewayi]RHB70449.1 homocysteine methyltransferase [Hungatella hathewayi]UWO87590.1 homocysteine S-methyltransferase family protein [Hungatella hathewayi]